jgi:pyruvate kinase
MTSNELRTRTKIVWSVNCRASEIPPLLQLIQQNLLAAIRIIYDPLGKEQILDFIAQLGKTPEFSRAKLPLMIDVGSVSQGSLMHLGVAQDLSYGQKLNLSPPGEGGDLQLEGFAWDEPLPPGTTMYIGNGAAVVKTLAAPAKKFQVEVVLGGQINVGQEIQVPSTRKPLSLFDLAYIDIKPYQKLGISYVVLPGIANPREFTLARRKLNSGKPSSPWLLIKIDSKEVFANLKNLLPAVNGVVISRRDLALTMEAATIPMVCKEIIRECNQNAKLVLMESDMLASMRANPTPTRAEVSDVANAVIDGTDAVILSEELAVGKYPLKAAGLCQNVISTVEANGEVELNWQRVAPDIQNEFDAVAFHAYKTAERIQAKAIVCITKTGNTALRIASFRSAIPIIAVTFSEPVRRKLAIIRGVSAIVLDEIPSLDEVLSVLNDRLKSFNWLSSGDQIIFTTVSLSPLGDKASNLFTIQRLI